MKLGESSTIDGQSAISDIVSRVDVKLSNNLLGADWRKSLV